MIVSAILFASKPKFWSKANNIAETINNFHGVARRFDFIKKHKSGAVIYDDYAHNPEKIISCLKGAREICDGKIFLVFQPHGYGPLGFMQEPLFELLENELRGENELFIMLEPYYAGGTSSFSPHSSDVIANFQAKSTNGAKYLYLNSRDEVKSFLNLHATQGDTIMIMGARDNSLPVFANDL